MMVSNITECYMELYHYTDCRGINY